MIRSKITSLYAILICVSLFFSSGLSAQEKDNDTTEIEKVLSGLKFRSIGPAFMSGRIADIAIDPNNQNIWYVAVGSGGVWKTVNAGTTWSCLTENQPFYSTGCLTIDPNNSNTIWLGTGENVGGRHVGIGHGIYVSHDGGKNWKQSGLTKSEHISKIIVNPKNSQEIWVASQGPLWSSGGERGLFKSVDGGKTWKLTLKSNPWTGVTDIVIDPRNEKILYAATWQRHRNVAAYIGSGEGTALYKSTDGGETWSKLTQGLPKVNMGKIGLAISPIDPDILYAAIELERKKGAIYRSDDQGASWTKMSDTVSGGTGPHYYQELVASPHVFDKIYLMNVRVLVSEDGGKTFYTMKEVDKHSDNHSLTFKPNDPNYLLIGTDGGIYESFDDSQTWKFVNNLPITQFYKLAVDDAEPFYTIYGGTQDNNSQGGPSRTFKSSGISNSDWYVVLGGDGHQPATEPGNPDILYAQSQQGNIRRIERKTGEYVYIKPQAGVDEPYERFNWDSPILVSHHNPKRLYFGSQRVWRSDDRGDSWTPVSEDLTKNEERLSLPIMGKVQSWDEAWDVYAMSTYNTITSLSESPIDENLIFAGTDDGIIQFTTNGGQSWNRILVGSLPGVPATAFVNDIKTDLHDVNKVYVALDNHKFGDYKPYFLKSVDGGKSWRSMTRGIPDQSLVWRMVQDHVNPNLLFLGTEYGIYVSLDQGNSWHKFSSGIPTIPIRDLAIQKRENDLVAATFGRGFYILDDYTPLRSIKPNQLDKAQLFKPRKALQYEPIRGGTSSQGANYFTAKNPDYGAVFTFYIPEKFNSKKAVRQKKEKALKKENKDIPFPGWEALDAEKTQEKPSVTLVISDLEDRVVTRIERPYKQGINRVAWNLKKPLAPYFYDNSKTSDFKQVHVSPGTYKVALYSVIGGHTTALGAAQTFEVERIRENTLKNPISDMEINNFIDELETFLVALEHTKNRFQKASTRLKTLERAMQYIEKAPGSLEQQMFDLNQSMLDIKTILEGSASKKEIGEKDVLSIAGRLSVAQSSLVRGTYGPTKMQLESFNIAKTLYSRIKPKIEQFTSAIPNLEKQLLEAGAPIIMD
ncbi:WD40/YVTN/BNR-like repeat-containing protein [Aestuariivivens sediminicola]|uniref:WD40/YVTN/BNR-like repeat-containing protein n=1 Tax=Aestuariivivens sediminicola TaxID=2913560 RepID=UPI001F56A5F8|nr:glycosyl hydrolase [Aestuariivivens sediminicola]